MDVADTNHVPALGKMGLGSGYHVEPMGAPNYYCWRLRVDGQDDHDYELANGKLNAFTMKRLDRS